MIETLDSERPAALQPKERLGQTKLVWSVIPMWRGPDRRRLQVRIVPGALPADHEWGQKDGCD